MKTPQSPSFQTVFKPGLFAGRTAIVTGGGSGIGRCIAHELSALGACVALVGRKLEKLEAVAREIAQAGGTATLHSCDIREEEPVRETVAAIVAGFGHVDFLVNNGSTSDNPTGLRVEFSSVTFVPELASACGVILWGILVLTRRRN